MAQESWNLEPEEAPCGNCSSTGGRGGGRRREGRGGVEEELAVAAGAEAHGGVEGGSEEATVARAGRGGVRHQPLASAQSSSSACASSLLQQQPAQLPSRCFACRKRLGLAGFKCRCGDVFCSLHRYSDEHSCSFDYKAAARAAISKANPVVKAAKIEKI